MSATGLVCYVLLYVICTIIRSSNRRGQLRYDFKQITDNAVIRDLENRRVWIFIDRHDDFGILHARLVLNRAGNTHRDVQLRRDDFAGLADLQIIGHKARIHRSA